MKENPDPKNYYVYDTLGNIIATKLTWVEARDMCATSDHLYIGTIVPQS